MAWLHYAESVLKMSLRHDDSGHNLLRELNEVMMTRTKEAASNKPGSLCLESQGWGTGRPTQQDRRRWHRHTQSLLQRKSHILCTWDCTVTPGQQPLWAHPTLTSRSCVDKTHNKQHYTPPKQHKSWQKRSLQKGKHLQAVWGEKESKRQHELVTCVNSGCLSGREPSSR